MKFGEFYITESINIKRFLSYDEALKLIKRIRVSGKRKGEKEWDEKIEIGEYALVDFPIDLLDAEEIDTLEQSSNIQRVKEYAKTSITEPIYVFKTRKTKRWYVADGGHRVTASIIRGDKTVPAIVPYKDLENQIQIKEEKDLILSILKTLKSEADIVNYDWDKVAFGFSVDDIIEVTPNELKVKYKTDYENAKYKIDNESKFGKHFKDEYNKLPPIEVSYKNGEFFIEDGHHRYYYAKKNKIGRVKIKIIDIKDNPIIALGYTDIDQMIKQWKNIK